MEEKAYDFADQWLGKDLQLAKVEEKDQGLEFVFYPLRDGAVLYFNELKVRMMAGNVVSAELTYWEVTDEAEETYALLPMDEILYALLGSIKEEMVEDQKDEVVQIINGYQLVKSNEQSKAVPAITIVMGSGKEYVMNRTAV